MKILKELCMCHGPSGREDDVRETIIKRIHHLVDEVIVDSLGNLIAHKKGTGKKLMFAAHMDEIGLIATEIDKNGFIRFAPVGNVALAVLPGTMVQFKDGPTGVINFEVADGFIAKKDFSKLFIDIGAKTKKQVEKVVRVGDMATFQSSFLKANNRVISKSLDDRIGCYILIKMIEAVDKSKMDLYFAFTVQEEVGLRGGKTSGYQIDPDFAVAVDVTKAGDTPKGIDVPVKLGKGAAIKVKDQRLITSPIIRDSLIDYCKDGKIRYQLEVLRKGTTDAAIIQTVKTGVPTGTVSIPTRYIHTPSEIADLDDIKSTIKLLKIVMERGF